jgi:predicted RNase H-like HicB family nuclease
VKGLGTDIAECWHQLCEEYRKLVIRKEGGYRMKFNVILEKAEEGGYNVGIPALDGCFTQGETEKEALKNAKEAILCYLEGLEKVNQIKSKPGVTLRELEVTL